MSDHFFTTENPVSKAQESSLKNSAKPITSRFSCRLAGLSTACLYFNQATEKEHKRIFVIDQKGFCDYFSGKKLSYKRQKSDIVAIASKGGFCFIGPLEGLASADQIYLAKEIAKDWIEKVKLRLSTKLNSVADINAPDCRSDFFVFNNDPKKTGFSKSYLLAPTLKVPELAFKRAQFAVYRGIERSQFATPPEERPFFLRPEEQLEE